MTTTDPRLAEWVDLARRKWTDYQRVLAERPVGDIAVRMRERTLAEMVPHLLAAYEAQWTDTEAWLKGRRDELTEPDGSPWHAFDDALDDFREHMHSGTPLTEAVKGPHHEEQG